MQITVKSTKVLKTGTNDYGEWNLVQVTTIEDIKYTTLAKEAEAITPGSIINITDMDKDEKERESFKKFEVVEQASTQKVSRIESAPQEIGMWWKELGEMIRAKDIDISKPEGKLMRNAYYAQMLSVLSIKFEKKES